MIWMFVNVLFNDYPLKDKISCLMRIMHLITKFLESHHISQN